MARRPGSAAAASGEPAPRPASPDEIVPVSEPRLYLLRFSGEVSTKAQKTRARFVRRLARNAQAALGREGIEHRLQREWSRLYVEAADPRAGEVLGRVFGIHSLSPVIVRPWSALADLVAAGEELFASEVAGRSFAVRARRAGDRKKIPIHATDLERELGTALLAHAREVDLDEPEVTVQVEVRPEQAYFFTRVLRGQGGLPLGVEGRALALVSGGFDSAVAAWMMLRRGLALDYLYFHLGAERIEDEVLGVMRVLADRWSYGDRPRLHVVDFRPLVAELGEAVWPRYRQVVLKRLMLRAGEAVARERGFLALVTGEAIGQVSSQTPQNLAAISHPVELPVFRPLLGFHKEEILERARQIGTHDLSARVPEHCALVPRHPATRAARTTVDRAEATLDPGYLDQALAARRTHDLRRLDPVRLRRDGSGEDGSGAEGLPGGGWGGEELGVDEIPPGAAVLDLRPRAAFEAWHPPGALRLDFFDALARLPAFDRGRSYLVCCELGLKSAHLAEALRRSGCRAFYLRREAYRRLEGQLGDDPLAAHLLAPAVPGD